MATATFTLVAASTTTTVTLIPGSLRLGGGNDLRGGRVTGGVVAANARNGSLQAVSDSTTETTLTALVSKVGTGDYTIAIEDHTTSNSYAAVVDVAIGEGEDGPEVATITWKGTVSA